MMNLERFIGDDGCQAIGIGQLPVIDETIMAGSALHVLTEEDLRKVLSELDLAALDRRVVFAWVTREETGLHGADALARSLRPRPEAVFPVDTFVSSDSPRDDPRFAFAPLGAGPVLLAMDSSSIVLPRVLERMYEIAGRHGIALQAGIVAGGNDGSRFVPQGAVNCPLSWPQRCSHTRVETMDLRDLEALAELVRRVAAEY